MCPSSHGKLILLDPQDKDACILMVGAGKAGGHPCLLQGRTFFPAPHPLWGGGAGLEEPAAPPDLNILRTKAPLSLHSLCFSSMRLVGAYWANKENKMKIQPTHQALVVHTRDISGVIGRAGLGGKPNWFGHASCYFVECHLPSFQDLFL